MKKIVNLELLVSIFTNVLHDGERGSLHNRKLEKIFIELEKARRFYWVNSHCMLNLSFTWLITDKEVSFDGWWLPPDKVYPIVDEALKHVGLDRERDFDGVIAIWATPVYDESPDPVGYVWGPGGTVRRYSSFQVNGALAWLFVHEFHHQLDEFFKLSGMPEYPHADFPQKLPGFFGEHFDFNAYILRSWPEEKWLKLSFPHPDIWEVKDSDGDGIPDEDPRVPVDEARFGSNPFKKDTDDDGLDDLRELMAGIYYSSDPTKPDTDGDDIPDGIDEYPLYPIKTAIHEGKWTFISDGFLMQRYFEVSPSIAAKWSPEKISFRILVNNACNIHVYLDANADGWYHGKDNYEILVDVKPKKEEAVKVHVLDCSNPEKVLWDDDPKYGSERLIRENDVKVKVSRGKKPVTVDIDIYPSERTGFSLYDGKEIGFRIEFTRNGKWASLFEKYSFVKLKLVKEGSSENAGRNVFKRNSIKYIPPPYLYVQTVIGNISKHLFTLKNVIKNHGSKALDVDMVLEFEGLNIKRKCFFGEMEGNEVNVIEVPVESYKRAPLLIKPKYRLTFRDINGNTYRKSYWGRSLILCMGFGNSG